MGAAARLTALTRSQVVPSTTSHKHEPAVPTLDLFARLGFRELDLNLNYVIDNGVPIGDIVSALAANGQRAAVTSGGWCDFFDRAPKIEETFASVARQAALARRLGAPALRLFFGRLEADRYDASARETATANIRRIADECPDILLMFENHDGASSRPDVCVEIIEGVDRPNARLLFDPVNFEHRGVRSVEAVGTLHRFIAHVHLKGYSHGQFCEFGAGETDLGPVLARLADAGYPGGFTVEYEGTFDRTLRLCLGLQAATCAVDRAAYARNGIGSR